MYPDQGLSGGVSEAVGCLDRASPLAGESKCRPERCGGAALGPWKSGDGVESVASCSAHCQLRHGASLGVDTPGSAPPLGCREAGYHGACWQIRTGEKAWNLASAAA